MKSWQRLVIALVAGVLAGGAAGSLAYLKGMLVDPGLAKEHGEFRAELNADLFQAATAYAEQKIMEPGQRCVSRWVGMDDRYVYLATGCAKFSQQYGQVRAYGDQGYRAVRIRKWWGKKVFGFAQADPEHLYQSMRTLFPHAAAEEWWKRSSPQDYLQQGAKFTGN